MYVVGARISLTSSVCTQSSSTLMTTTICTKNVDSSRANDASSLSRYTPGAPITYKLSVFGEGSFPEVCMFVPELDA